MSTASVYALQVNESSVLAAVIDYVGRNKERLHCTLAAY
jgi:hypothetical protein